ncbi:hypothetical protein ACWEOG_37685 [Amycolatopsis japonica]
MASPSVSSTRLPSTDIPAPAEIVRAGNTDVAQGPVEATASETSFQPRPAAEAAARHEAWPTTGATSESGRQGHPQSAHDQRVDEVIAVPLTDRHGKVIGVDFTADSGDVAASSRWAQGTRDAAFSLASSHRDPAMAVAAGDYRAVGMPRADVADTRTFVVSAHGTPGGFQLSTSNGTQLEVSGGQLAGAVVRSSAFARAVAPGKPTSFTLVACAAAVPTDREAPASAFSRALKHEFSLDRPVHAPRNDVSFAVPAQVTRDSALVTHGEDGWATFDGGFERAQAEAAPAVRGRLEADVELSTRRTVAADVTRTRSGAPPPLGEQPEEAALVAEAIKDRPALARPPQAAALRENLKTAVGDSAQAREAIDRLFSDDNVKSKFGRALVGAHVEDLGPRPGRDAVEVTVRVAGLRPVDTPRTAAVDKDVEFEIPAAKLESKWSSSRTPALALPNQMRVPAPFFYAMPRVAGAINDRDSTASVTRSRERSRKVVESGWRLTEKRFVADYSYTVRKENGVVTTGRAEVPVALDWPAKVGEEGQARANLHQVEAGEFADWSGVERAIGENLGGFALNDPAVRDLRTWLTGLDHHAADLLSGRALGTSFRFHGQKSDTEVRVSLTNVRARDMGAGVKDGKVENTIKAGTERSVGDGTNRKWLAEFRTWAGFTVGGVGPVFGGSRATNTVSEEVAKVERETTQTYHGPLVRDEVEFQAVVSIRQGRGPNAGSLIPGKVTVWTRPDVERWSAEPTDDGTSSEHDLARDVVGGIESWGSAGGDVPSPSSPRSDPIMVATQARRALDHVGARYRIPEETISRITGAAIHRLRTDGHLSAHEVPLAAQRVRQYLRDNAHHVVRSGDGVRIPMSTYYKHAPDVFLRAEVRIDPAAPSGQWRRDPHVKVDSKITSSHDSVMSRARTKQYIVGVTGGTGLPPWYAFGEMNRQPKTVHTRKWLRRFQEEQIIRGKENVRQWKYEAEFKLVIGGEWSKLDRGVELPGLLGEVEFDAPETPGRPTETLADTLEPPAEALEWRTGSPRQDMRAGHLPGEYQLESLRPLPGLLGMATTMVDMPTSREKWFNRITRIFAGGAPRRFDQHNFSKFLGKRDVDRQTHDEHDASLNALEEWAGPSGRAAGFTRAAIWRDPLTIKAHNPGGLFGAREQTARVELETVLRNPRIIATDDAHEFSHVAQTQLARENEVKRSNTIGGFSGVSVFGIPGSTVAGGFSVVSGSRAKTTERSDSAKVTASETATHTEPGYLVAYDATHILRTSVRPVVADGFGLLYRQPERKAHRWADQREAATVWVPASEIGSIGVLTDTDLKRLRSEDQIRHVKGHEDLTAQRVAELLEAPRNRSLSPVRGSTELTRLSIPFSRAETLATIPENDREWTMSPDRPLVASPLPVTPELVELAPSDAGVGTGTAELRGARPVARIVGEVHRRLDEWTQLDTGRRNTRSMMTRFRRINDHLVNDVLGPQVMTAGGKPAFAAMLNGGLPLYRQADKAFGKIEQLVVLRATLGEGHSPQPVSDHSAKNEQQVEHKSGTGESTAYSGGVSAGAFVTHTGTHDLAVAGSTSAGASHTRTYARATTQERTDKVTSSVTGDFRRFIHDVTIHMDVYPYARAGTYTKPLSKVLPALTVDQVREPWRTSFVMSNAARSIVPAEDVVVLETPGTPRPPISEVAGSLRRRQREAGFPLGLSGDARMQVTPFVPAQVHAAVEWLAEGRRLTHRGALAAPALTPNAAYQLRLGLSTHMLRANLNAAMSEGGYVVPVHGGPLGSVRVEVDLHDVALEKTVEGFELKETTKAGATIGSDRATTVTAGGNAELRQPRVQEAPSRPGQRMFGADKQLTEATSKRKIEFATSHNERADEDRLKVEARRAAKSKGDPEPKEAGYLVRATPRWRVTPVYRGKRAPSGWGEPLILPADSPVRFQVNEAGLRQLGLPSPNGNAVEGQSRESGAGLLVTDPDAADRARALTADGTRVAAPIDGRALRDTVLRMADSTPEIRHRVENALSDDRLASDFGKVAGGLRLPGVEVMLSGVSEGKGKSRAQVRFADAEEAGGSDRWTAGRYTAHFEVVSNRDGISEAVVVDVPVTLERPDPLRPAEPREVDDDPLETPPVRGLPVFQHFPASSAAGERAALPGGFAERISELNTSFATVYPFDKTAQADLLAAADRYLATVPVTVEVRFESEPTVAASGVGGDLTPMLPPTGHGGTRLVETGETEVIAELRSVAGARADLLVNRGNGELARTVLGRATGFAYDPEMRGRYGNGRPETSSMTELRMPGGAPWAEVERVVVNWRNHPGHGQDTDARAQAQARVDALRDFAVDHGFAFTTELGGPLPIKGLAGKTASNLTKP